MQASYNILKLGKPEKAMAKSTHINSIYKIVVLKASRREPKQEHAYS
jgi:hypothetical protein